MTLKHKIYNDFVILGIAFLICHSELPTWVVCLGFFGVVLYGLLGWIDDSRVQNDPGDNKALYVMDVYSLNGQECTVTPYGEGEPVYSFSGDFAGNRYSKFKAKFLDYNTTQIIDWDELSWVRYGKFCK